MRKWAIFVTGAVALGGLVAVLLLWQREETLRGVAESTMVSALEPAAPPSFTLLRLGPDRALTAEGKAAPGATVALSIDGKPRVQLRADERGEWIVTLSDAFSPGDHVVGLVMRLPDAREIAGEEVAAVALPRRGSAAPFIAVLRSQGPSRLEQAAEGTVGPPLRLQAVDYLNDGMAVVSGRSMAGASVHLFRGETALGSAQAGEDGGWSVSVAAETLQERQGEPEELRLVALAEDGSEQARVGAPLPLPPSKGSLPEAAYARIAAEGQQWRLLWRDGEGEVHRSTLYSADASFVIESLPTPEPRP